MTKAMISKSMKRLPVTKRIELVDELIYSIAQDQSKIPVSDAQKAMIDECLEEIEKHPGRGMTLGQFKKKLRETANQMRSDRGRKGD